MGKDLNGKELGMGFSQRKDGRYEARAMINGVKISLYNMKLTVLRKEFELRKAEVLQGNSPVKSNITFAEWYGEWFKTCKSPQLKSDVSRRTYDRKIRNTYVEILGRKRVRDITQIDIQNATNELVEKGYSDRTVKEALGVARECFTIAIVNHIINGNPCTSINVKDANVQKERRVLEHWEQELFISEVKNNYYYEPYMILLCTGMRIGEFSGLQWGDIDFENKCITIRRSMQTAYFDGRKVEELTTPKTSNSYREIPFFGDVENLLYSWQKKQQLYREKLGDRWRANPELGDLVFTSTMGSPVTRYVLSHDMKKVVQNINLKEVYRAVRENRQPREFEHIHPHAFRHTFATRCFEKGLDPLFVQSIMEHANYSTTVSYTHILQSTKQKELAKTANFLD